MQYFYGMRLRGYSIGCQPDGATRIDDVTGRFHDVLVYDRKLTDSEVRQYALTYMFCKEDKKNDVV